MPHFLNIPSDPLDARAPDEAFLDQVEALRDAGFAVSLFSFEALQAGNAKIRGALSTSADIVYRGWMMTPGDYGALVALVENQGGRPLTSIANYRACHYLPGWYPTLADLTAETKVLPVDADFATELGALGWGKFFLKD
jgi:hypothetical protein